MKVLSCVLSQPVRRLSQKIATKTLPQPKGWPLIGTMLDLITAGGGPKLHLYVDSRHKQLGPIFCEALGPGSATFTFISNPRDMRKVFGAEGKYPVHLLPDAWLLYNRMNGSERGLFFMDGEMWLKYRHIMNKIMLKTEPSDGLINAYKTATKDMVDEWLKSIPKPVDNVVHHMYKLSISYVVAMLLGSSYGKYRHQVVADVERLASVVHLIYEESTKLNLMPAKIAATLRLPVWRRFTSAVESTLSLGNNLVSQLIPLAADDGILRQMYDEGISHEKAVSIIVDFMLAAADTTPYTMVWALYMLARNPEVQTQLAEDVKQCSPQLWLTHPLLRSVTRETLRLYPAAPFLTRQLASDVELSGYLVPSGEMIIMSLYTSGRSEDYFPEALRFWPERWLRNGSKYQGVLEASASLPFAMGGRSCIGRRVAESLLSLTLAEILSQIKINVKKEIEMVLMLVPVPAEPVKFYLTKRNNNFTL